MHHTAQKRYRHDLVIVPSKNLVTVTLAGALYRLRDKSAKKIT